LVAVFTTAVMVRLVFASIAPYESGDWVLYKNVALNILDGCGVAVTAQTSTGCTPHFGGNQLPLFPGFVAGVWLVFGESDGAVRIVQSFIAAAAVAYLARAVLVTFRTRLAMVMAGALMAISPVQAYWAGALLTEALAIATTGWVTAELLLSYAAGRIRVVPVGVAIAVATWMRMDAVLLLIPMAFTGWYLAWQITGPSLRRALRDIIMVVLIVATPCIMWSVRNIAVGLSPLPRPSVLPDGSYAPHGYFAWVNSWVTRQDQRSDALFFGVNSYDHIRIDSSIYSDRNEELQVAALLQRLRSATGKAFPSDVDASFERLAQKRKAAMTIPSLGYMTLQRTWTLTARWIWPWTSNGGDGRAGGSPTDYYRFLLVIAFLMTICFGWSARDRATRFVVTMIATYAGARILFFAASANVELRYTVELSPMLEAAAGAGLAAIWISIRQALKAERLIPRHHAM